MPEGDTVWHTAAALHAALAGNVLLRSDFRHPALATADVAGYEVLGVYPVGKHLFARLAGESGSVSLHSHLRMDGSWRVYRTGQRWRMPAHHARVILTAAGSEAVGFRVHDLRLLRTRHEDSITGHLGPDLLDPEWSAEHASRAARGLAADPDRELGLALLDQRTMSGIGNVYKNEICFLLGVSPWAPVSAVDPEQAVELAHTLLMTNVSRPRRFLRSTTGELERGRRTWVYERTRAGCLRCGGVLRSGTQGAGVGARPTWCCPHCQQGPYPARPGG